MRNDGLMVSLRHAGYARPNDQRQIKFTCAIDNQETWTSF